MYRSTGYFAPKAKFILSISAPNKPSLDISEDIKNAWDPLWQKENAYFEAEIQGTKWEFLSNKMLYIWDGNHRYKAWMAQIEADKLYLKFLLILTIFIID